MAGFEGDLVLHYSVTMGRRHTFNAVAVALRGERTAIETQSERERVIEDTRTEQKRTEEKMRHKRREDNRKEAILTECSAP